MTSIDGSSILRPASDVRFRVVDREAVVVRQRSAEVLVMNEVAARLLALADGVHPVSHWLDVLVGEFEVDRAALESDVMGFASELADEGLLEVVK
ncbi:MAG: PqqD family protein [Acidobacteriota bacterium]